MLRPCLLHEVTQRTEFLDQSFKLRLTKVRVSEVRRRLCQGNRILVMVDYHPNEAWVKEQARAFLDYANETGLGTAMVMHDRDTKFTASFDDVLKAGDVKVQKAAHRSPNTVAFVERFIQTLQQECLDYFVVIGQQHMNHLVSEMVAHYQEEPPHQAMENDPLIQASPEPPKKKSRGRKASPPPPDVVPIGDIECRQRLGGLLKHYSRKAS